MIKKEWFETQEFLSRIEYWRSHSTIDIGEEDEETILRTFDSKNGIFLCNKGKLDSKSEIIDAVIEGRVISQKDTSISDSRVEQYEQYLIIITTDNYPIVLAHWISANKSCPRKKFSDKKDFKREKIDYRNMKRDSVWYDTLIYYKITKTKQMNQLLDILIKKYRDLNGHFYNINETLIYESICPKFLYGSSKVRDKLLSYLKLRNEKCLDNYKVTNNHCIKVYSMYSCVESTYGLLYNLLEFPFGCYLNENEDIIALKVQKCKRGIIDIYNDYYIKTKNKEEKIKVYLFARAYIPETDQIHDKNIILPWIPYGSMPQPYLVYESKDIITCFRGYFNQYIEPQDINDFNITTFSILPKTEKQLKQIQNLMEKFRNSSKLDLKVMNSLNKICIGDLDAVEPLNIVTLDSSSETKQLESKLSIKIDDEKQKLIETKTIEQLEKQKQNNQLLQLEKQITSSLEQLNVLYQLQEKLRNSKVETKRITVPLEQLLIQVNDHFEINPLYIDYLQYIYLALIDFKNVKVSGIDFSNTDVTCMDPQTVYQKDMSNGNYEGINFEWKDFTGVNISNSHFTQGFFQYNFENTISESTCYVNKK